MTEPRYYLLRLSRRGPLVPARLQEIDHEFGVPENKRDRWPPTTIVVDIAGEVVDPGELFDRLFAPSEGDYRPGLSPTHWKYPKPISADEYSFRMKHLRWTETARPDDPVLRPRRRIDPRTARLPQFGDPR